jgi:hypothetical protein
MQIPFIPTEVLRDFSYLLQVSSRMVLRLFYDRYLPDFCQFISDPLSDAM